jgi:hypothetical protein
MGGFWSEPHHREQPNIGYFEEKDERSDIDEREIPRQRFERE